MARRKEQPVHNNGSGFSRLLKLSMLTHEDRARLTDRLQTIIVGLIVGLTSLLILHLFIDIEELAPNLIILAAAVSYFVIALVWLRQGHLMIATFLVLLFLFAATASVAVNSGGIYDTSLAAYFLLIAIAGLLLGGNAAFIVAGLAALAVAGVYFLRPGPLVVAAQEPALDVVEMGVLFLLMGLILRLTINDLNGALLSARREVAERKAAEAALAEVRDKLEERVIARTAELAQANQDLQTLIESSRDGILFLNDSLLITVINSRALELLGLTGDVGDWQYRPAEALIEALRETTPQIASAAREELQLLSIGDRQCAEGEIETPSSILRWHTHSVRMHAGNVAQLIVFRDVTRERMAEQTRADLIRAMVHDLRTPLTGMLASLDIIHLLDERGEVALSSKQQRYLQQTSDTARKMVRLVENILDVNRLESGQFPLKRRAVSVAPIIASVSAAQRPLAAEKQLIIRQEIATDLPDAWADKAMLERILQNLLDNAIKFTPRGKEITLRAEREPDVGNGQAAVRLTVADTGPGVPPDLEAHLFRKFVTGDHERSGRGLGLAFCKLAVEAHDGHLWMESEPGAGAAFLFTLPAVSPNQNIG